MGRVADQIGRNDEDDGGDQQVFDPEGSPAPNPLATASNERGQRDELRHGFVEVLDSHVGAAQVPAAGPDHAAEGNPQGIDEAVGRGSSPEHVEHLTDLLHCSSRPGVRTRDRTASRPPRS